MCLILIPTVRKSGFYLFLKWNTTGVVVGITHTCFIQDFIIFFMDMQRIYETLTMVLKILNVSLPWNQCGLHWNDTALCKKSFYSFPERGSMLSMDAIKKSEKRWSSHIIDLVTNKELFKIVLLHENENGTEKSSSCSARLQTWHGFSQSFLVNVTDQTLQAKQPRQIYCLM